MNDGNSNRTDKNVIPQGELIHLSVDDLRASPQNPRVLFDPEPLATLRNSIEQHGVLVPITVYRLPGQAKYSIVDGERRYRCCLELSNKGKAVSIPANLVAPPDSISSLIYMFNIHQFRQQWELMPTALALSSVIDILGTRNENELLELTGLSERQLERCMLILSFDDQYQRMSLDEDPQKRIPSNFWVELHPVLELAEKHLPDIVVKEGRDGITDRLVEKYRKKNIRSVIHFRRILEAFDVQEDSEDGLTYVVDRLREYVLDVEYETRKAFDGFISDKRRVEKVNQAVDQFIQELKKAKIEHVSDEKGDLIERLKSVVIMVEGLLSKLEGDDPPQEEEEEDTP